MSQCRESSSSITLRKSGERCCTTTNAIPGFGGRFAKNCSSDSSPPADAPMPTTRNFDGFSMAGFETETDSELTDILTLLAAVNDLRIFRSAGGIANKKPIFCAWQNASKKRLSERGGGAGR